MAIPSGLSSQIVCGPGVFFPPFRVTFWCLFWVWGPSGTPWFSALNLTGIHTSILTYFWITFLLFCRCYFQGFFVSFPDLYFCNFYWKWMRLGAQRAAQETYFPVFLWPKRKVGKWRSVSTEHHISRLGEALTGASQAFFPHLLFERRRQWKNTSRNWFSIDFRAPAATRLSSFWCTFCNPEKNCEKRPKRIKNRQGTSPIFTYRYTYIYPAALWAIAV